MRAPLIVLACCSVLTVVSPAADTPSAFQLEHQVAAGLLAEKKWERAVVAYRRIIADGPDDSLALNAQLGVARALAGARKYDDAAREYLVLKPLIARQRGAGRLSEEQVEEAWIYAMHRGIGACMEMQKKERSATASYLSAVRAIGDHHSLADWRARAWLDAARCLVRIGKHKVAIKMLTEIVPELAPAEFAGMRALVKARLARIYMEDGERDWAVTLLEEIRGDPQLDAQQFATAEAMAEGREWKQAVKGTMRTRKGPDYLAIESVGRFELRIALQPNGRNLFGENRYGWIMGWYNLEDDPFKTTNLSALSSCPLIEPHQIGWMDRVDGKWKRLDSKRHKEYSNTVDLNLGMQKGPIPGQAGTVTFEILEDNPARVRTRTRHNRWPFETFEYTFHPTGQIIVAARFSLEHAEPPLRIGEISFSVAKNPRINWREAGEGSSRMSGEGGKRFETPFVLAHSNATPSFQRSMPDDILTFPSFAHQSRSFINHEMIMQWRRARLRFPCDEKSESRHFALQLRIYPRNIDSFALAKFYVDDYQSPARLEVTAGGLVTEDPGDLNRDGFNECEGCYVVTGAKAVVLQAGDLARHQPAIKFLNPGVHGVPGLMVNGKIAPRESYNLAWIGPRRLLLQWFGVIGKGETMRFELN